jgi:hypothetical protein
MSYLCMVYYGIKAHRNFLQIILGSRSRTLFAFEIERYSLQVGRALESNCEACEAKPPTLKRS